MRHSETLQRMKSDVQEDEEDQAMFLCGGSAEHCDHRLVCGVCRARGGVLVSAPTGSGHFTILILF